MTVPRMTDEEFNDLSEAAFAWASHMANLRDVEHEAFHGRPIRRVKVGQRPGYRGTTVCADCTYRKAWPG